MIITPNPRAVLDDTIAAFKRIGYRSSWLKQNYSFTDLYTPSAPSRSIHLGVFGQFPLDYRSACFGVQFASQGENAEEVVGRVCSLGAPQLLYIKKDNVERWKVKANGGELIDKTPLANIAKLIQLHNNDWNPTSILRAKSNFVRPDPRNTDFVDLGLLPALEHEAAKKIDELVRKTCSMVETHFTQKKIKLNAQELFGIIFQLLVGKLLVDRKILTTPVIDFNNAGSVLSAVRNHYPSHDHDVLANLKFPHAIANNIAQEIGNSFSFSNLSAETLTYVYENTFVSAESRKALGIHSTPSFLADYVLSQMPIEDINRQVWNVLDPTCGHGIFLIAAMRRMRALLPADWTPKKRHSFFARRLHGVDMEGFSLEVAKLCLMLADFPEPNGWDLRCHDIFTGDILENASRNATIIVGNPPFEKMEDMTPLRRKPAELLRRMLPELAHGSLFGMVLPRTFLDGNDYRNERQQLLTDFDLLSVCALPDKIFEHSEAESTIVIARKGKRKTQVFMYSEVLDGQQKAFKESQKTSWADCVPLSYLSATPESSFVVPRLRNVWEYLSTLPKMDSVANIKTGIRYKSSADQKLTYLSKAGSKRRLGISTVDETFEQYTCEGQIYFSLEEDLQQNGAWQYDWDKDKVIIPASRNSRGPWRYAAALDRNGLCVSRRFYGVWPKESDVSISSTVLTAILNGPIAAAYVYTHSFQKDIRVETYKNIPFPKLERLFLSSRLIECLVNEYIENTHELVLNENKLHQLLLKIDAEVLKLYDLPPQLERKILNLFLGVDRRVPFQFSGYIPQNFKPSIPLHMYISPEIGNARADRVMERLPTTKNQKTLEFLKSFEDDIAHED